MPRPCAVASSRVGAFFVAASVKLHGARPWHQFARSLKTGGLAIHCLAFMKLVDLAKAFC